MTDPLKNDDKVLSGNIEKILQVNAVASKALDNSIAITSRATGATLLSVGKATSEFVAKNLSTASTITITSTGGGSFELRPGAIWNGNKMLIKADTSICYYTIDDRLYSSLTSIFLRSEWFYALAQGSERANHIIWLAKAEMVLLEGIFVPWYLMLGMFAAKVGLFYYNNENLCKEALNEASKSQRLLAEFKLRYPLLFKKMLTTAAKEILLNLGEGVSSEDVAFFIGRMLGKYGIIGIASGGTELTLKIVLRIIAKMGLIVTATHSPSIIGNAASGVAKANAAVLQSNLAEAGLNVSEEESRVILLEFLSQTDSPKKLKELDTSLQKLIPILEQLQKDMHD